MKVDKSSRKIEKGLLINLLSNYLIIAFYKHIKLTRPEYKVTCNRTKKYLLKTEEFIDRLIAIYESDEIYYLTKQEETDYYDLIDKEIIIRITPFDSHVLTFKVYSKTNLWSVTHTYFSFKVHMYNLNDDRDIPDYIIQNSIYDTNDIGVICNFELKKFGRKLYESWDNNYLKTLDNYTKIISSEMKQINEKIDKFIVELIKLSLNLTA